MGPGGQWFDFACAAKIPSDDPRVTAGPEIEWEYGSGEKAEYDIFPLCEKSEDISTPEAPSTLETEL